MQNDPYSLFKMGCFYHFGIAVKVDFKKAIKYYVLAANRNNTDALLNLAPISLSNKDEDQISMSPQLTNDQEAQINKYISSRNAKELINYIN